MPEPFDWEILQRPAAMAMVRGQLGFSWMVLSGRLTALTDEQRDAIALRFFAGLSAREAAEVMGKQEGTVRGLQFRAIAALRRQLGIDLGTGAADGDDAVRDRRSAR